MPLASDNNVPKLVAFEPPKLTIPKKLNILSLKITLGITKADDVIIVPSVLGKICFNSDLIWTAKYAGICKDCYDKLKEQKNNGRYKK